MKYLLFTVSLLGFSCLPDEEAIVNRCEEAADRATEKCWDQCTRYYEDEILPDVISIIEELQCTSASKEDEGDPTVTDHRDAGI